MENVVIDSENPKIVKAFSFIKDVYYYVGISGRSIVRNLRTVQDGICNV